MKAQITADAERDMGMTKNWPTAKPARQRSPPPPTSSERMLRRILERNQIPCQTGRTIWYTSSHRYTPDLVIGVNLIVEVDGRVHDRPSLRTPDRIRQRALEAMGYHVIRVKNSEISRNPGEVAQKIAQTFYQITDTEVAVRVKAIRSQLPSADSNDERSKRASRRALSG